MVVDNDATFNKLKNFVITFVKFTELLRTILLLLYNF
jgi:hypothetical protein